MADITQVALTQFRMISGESVAEELVQEASDYFAGSESPVDPNTYRTWFLQVQANLGEQAGLIRLARKWQQRLVKTGKTPWRFTT